MFAYCMKKLCWCLFSFSIHKIVFLKERLSKSGKNGNTISKSLCNNIQEHHFLYCIQLQKFFLEIQNILSPIRYRFHPGYSSIDVLPSTFSYFVNRSIISFSSNVEILWSKHFFLSTQVWVLYHIIMADYSE